MENLQVVQHGSRRVLTTQQLAEFYNTHENNIKNNFNNNNKRFEEGKHFFLLKGDELKEFKEQVKDIDLVDKRASSLYLWTEKGASRHCKILDTDKAWERFEELEETYFRVKEENQFNNLSVELKAIIMLDKKYQEVDNRVLHLENTMTIDYAEQEQLNRYARERLVYILGGKESKAYKELSKKVFSNMWNKYKQAFKVSSYKNTSKKDFTEALKYISTWEPSKELGYMIKGANSQITFNN